MKNYCLVVRYRDNNEVQIVELNSKWYLEGEAKDTFSRRNFLEAIDLVTTKFRNREEMLARMFKNGYIRSNDADVYIASKRKMNGKGLLKIYEVVYNPNNNLRIADFRDIAKASLGNNFSSEIDKVKRVFDKLAAKVFYNGEFRDYLKSGFTNIYQQLMEMYVYSNCDGPAYNVKYENYWSLSSYLIVRNIIEAMNRFDLFRYEKDKVDANIEFLNENGVFRKVVEEELLEKLDKNYIEGQYSLFDRVENNKIEVAVGKKEVTAEKTTIIESNSEDISVDTYEDKRKFIYDGLKRMTTDVFSYENDKIVINKYLFNNYPSEQDKKKFLSLGSREIRTIFLYVLHYEKYMEALNNYENTINLEEELRNDRVKLGKIIEKDRKTDKLYEWCKAYLRCLEFAKEEKEGKKTWKKVLNI